MKKSIEIKKFTLDDFKCGLVVNCITKKQSDLFLKWCLQQGLFVYNFDYWFVHKSNTCYRYRPFNGIIKAEKELYNNVVEYEKLFDKVIILKKIDV